MSAIAYTQPFTATLAPGRPQANLCVKKHGPPDCSTQGRGLTGLVLRKFIRINPKKGRRPQTARYRPLESFGRACAYRLVVANEA